MKFNIYTILFALTFSISLVRPISAQDIPRDFLNPPREFSVMPFWFWNDTLKDDEIIRQISDFEAHGVYGFVIHPRIGLPDNVKWLSSEMIHSMGVAINEASKKKMYVVLYDEGMYPSGSSSGQVVARNPAHAAHGLAKIDLKAGEEPALADGAKLVTIINRPNGSRVAIIEQPSKGNIRGLHYIGEGGARLQEESPAAGDILNPEAVTSFIELVYDKYAKEFGKYFGTTIPGIFTDEPSPLGRSSARGVIPGNASLLPQIKSILGYDITPFLADLWYNDNPDSKQHRNDYNRAVNICLEENYYKRLGNWCKDHGISLMGHPAGSMDIGAERYFQIPGQDLVWRYVEPGPKALEGQHSTMAKCASSAMLHLGLRRNANELYGAYGHNLTFDEMEWLANWCFIRGQNFLIPHAFFYSIRGPRFEERPPDVGPHASWWDNYKPYADACRRLSWLNTNSKQVCNLAILSEATWLPDKSAKVFFQHQLDFNYLEIRHLWEDAKIDSKGVHIAGMNYGAIILDSLSYLPPEAKPFLEKLAKNSRLIIRNDSKFTGIFKGSVSYNSDENLILALKKIISPDITLTPASGNIRYRHVIKGIDNYYILFNEESSEVNTKFSFSIKGIQQWINPYTAETSVPKIDETVSFKPHELKILRIQSAASSNTYKADVIIYGGTSSAVTAAVQVVRMGKSVIIVSPDKHLGGLSSSGLGFTDTGNKEVIGGIAREFYQLIYNHYQKPESWNWQKQSEYGNIGQGNPAIDGKNRTMWIFEPHAAEEAFEQMIKENKIEVYRDEWLDRKNGVVKNNGSIISIKTLSGKTFSGKVFIDATYEGDLMASAGIKYTVGREASSVYNEQWNGVQKGIFHHGNYFKDNIDPYKIQGNPSSGLVPRISADSPGENGTGDNKIQAYCYRLCLTKNSTNKVPITKPEGYDSSQYELLARLSATRWNEFFGKYDPIPNLKTDVNNHGPFSFDNIGMNWDYPDASYERRKEILKEHILYQKGLLYFMATDLRIPEQVRETMNQWGFSKDEFTDNGYWPYNIYVREARRMLGQYVMTENDIFGKREVPRPIAMGSYTMDSHNVQRYVTPEGYVQNEGDLGVSPKNPYQIDLGSILPKPEECRNLLVPVCVSCSHIAFGSIRMEPVFMILGQSAGTVASMAIEEKKSINELSYQKIKTKLEADGQILKYLP